MSERIGHYVCQDDNNEDLYTAFYFKFYIPSIERIGVKIVRAVVNKPVTTANYQLL